ncbi:MAG: DUF1318 domain-containing protein [Opitutaceae bacterium]
MKRRAFFLFCSLVLGLFAAGSLFAAGAGDAKARMRERVPAVDRLKLAEAVGENNQGFLEVRKNEGDAAAVVAAENKDRSEVFGDTASRAGSTAAAVGKSFARQIAASSASGVWVQKDSGAWAKK